MPSRANHGQTTGGHHRLAITLISTAQTDIRTATRHLRGNGHTPHIPSLSDDACLLGIVFGVEHIDVNVVFAQSRRQSLRLGHVVRTHQHGLACLMQQANLLDNRVVLFREGRIHAVRFVETLKLAVSVNH